MNTKIMLTITAMVLVVGMSGIVMGLPSVPQADAANDYGKCNQVVNGFDRFYGLESGKGLADHRKDFCSDYRP